MPTPTLAKLADGSHSCAGALDRGQRPRKIFRDCLTSG
jgi:hypothetical protein